MTFVDGMKNGETRFRIIENFFESKSFQFVFLLLQWLLPLLPLYQWPHNLNLSPNQPSNPSFRRHYPRLSLNHSQQ